MKKFITLVTIQKRERERFNDVFRNNDVGKDVVADVFTENKRRYDKKMTLALCPNFLSGVSMSDFEYKSRMVMGLEFF